MNTLVLVLLGLVAVALAFVGLFPLATSSANPLSPSRTSPQSSSSSNWRDYVAPLFLLLALGALVALLVVLVAIGLSLSPESWFTNPVFL